MRRLKYICVVALLGVPVIAETSQAVHAAGGGGLVSAGSVRLSGLVGVSAADGGISNPETPTSTRAEGGAAPNPGPAPQVSGNAIAGAGAALGVTFAGLNHRDNRLANGGNQFSSEPPDQALCVGPNHVLEAVNTVLRVFDKTGSAVTPTLSFNEFFGYSPAFNRTTRVFGAFPTDPICHFDADSGRFFMAVLTLDLDPTTGDFTGKNRLDVAVSTTDDPTGTWNRYKLPVQNDGTEGTPDHSCSPASPPSPADTTNPTACIGDFPHIGTDANAVFLTTNEYSFFGPGYNGAQIYAISKAQLIAGATSPTMVSFESPVLGQFKSFTVWPAISPAGQASTASGGTEFFLSSTLGDGSETGNLAPSENRIGVWAVTHTSSINSATPNLRLSNKLITASTYTFPPASNQKDGPAPLRDCINDRGSTFGPGLGCWALFFNKVPNKKEKLSTPDSGDTRMNQVVYTGGRLFSALGTGVNVGGSTKAGVLWVNVQPTITGGVLGGAVVRKSGYVAVRGNNVTYPAVGVSSSGKVVMAATVMGDDHYPSASYTVISDANPTVRIISEGVGPDDGFTGYGAFVGFPPRTRWGDYGAVAMDGNKLWLASESIEQSCTLAQYLTAPIGSCSGTRTALANWGTRVSSLNI